MWLSYYNNRTAMAPMAFMVLAAAAAACASTHGCPLASVDGFLTAEDTPTRSSSHEFRRLGCNGWAVRLGAISRDLPQSPAISRDLKWSRGLGEAAPQREVLRPGVGCFAVEWAD